jgi:Fic family protein
VESALPSNSVLDDLSLEIAQESAALGAALPALTRRRVAALVHLVNGYWSSRLEGRNPQTADIERAMRDEYADDPAVRAWQREARAQVEVEQLLDQWVAEPRIDLSSPEFLRRVHWELYARVPAELRFVDDPMTRRREAITPGALRTTPTQVGRHPAPAPEALGTHLTRFGSAFDPTRLTRLQRIVAVAAGHQRLIALHPFLDGNGRVARLFTTAYAARAGIGGSGLWSLSRAIARRRDEYLAALAEAGTPRLDPSDTRGGASERALIAFCRLLLEAALEEIRAMRAALEIETLTSRILGYVALRESGHIPPPRSSGAAPSGDVAPGPPKLRSESGLLLRAVMLRGEVGRGEIMRITGLGERSARMLTSELLAEGLLESGTHRQPVRLGLPVHAVRFYFPLLFPDEA